MWGLIVLGHFGYGRVRGGAGWDGGHHVVVLFCLKTVRIRLACEVVAVSSIFCSLPLIGVECHRWFGTDIPTLHRGCRSLGREREREQPLLDPYAEKFLSVTRFRVSS